MDDPWFIKIELELTTGRTFKASLTRAETKQLAKGFSIHEDQPDSDSALARAAFNTLAYRTEAQRGGLVLPDAEGRVWYFEGSRIVAFGFEHRPGLPGSPRVIELGFRRRTPKPEG